MNTETPKTNPAQPGLSRRELLAWMARGLVGTALLAVLGRAARRPAAGSRMVWQVDPARCKQCGRCATRCVLEPSAVKCVHAFSLCGYCKRCFGFFQPDAAQLDESAEKQLCPTAALRRTFVEDPYFAYTIDEAACIGCGLCVKGCTHFGNGSLFLQIRQDRCVQCNECRIATACPEGAIVRVPAETPYIRKDHEQNPVPATRRAVPFSWFRRLGMLWGGLLAAALVVPQATQAAARFPQPQFESGYVLPIMEYAPVPQLVPPWVDAVVLVGALLLAFWVVYRRRSARLVLLLAVLCLAWFGFLRQGCLCPVGSVQNVALAVGQGGGLPWVAGVLFAAPLVMALVVGRVFCAAVCPFGALQELAIVRPWRVPAALDAVLRMVPVVVLAVALLWASTGSGFPVCRTDPFVGLFRLAAPWSMLLVGVGVLLLGMVIARPYCRYYCPYGVLLGWCARLTWRHVRITPDWCDNCRLCETVCPVDAIQPPASPVGEEQAVGARRGLRVAVLAAPVLVAGGAGVGWLVAHAARPMDAGFVRGGWWCGAAVAGVLAVRLIAMARLPGREKYMIDTGRCVNCARCFRVCPRQQEWRKRGCT
jgi:NosR/NirI family nitrous oxide reductase transcriptional regulator